MRISIFNLTQAARGLGFGLVLYTGLAVGNAATSGGQLSVNITVTASGGAGANTAAQSAPGVCISKTLSQRSNALVRVVCKSGQFVSITANPNARFLGVNGGAHQYVLNTDMQRSGSLTGLLGQSNDFNPGTGTVTAWQVYNVDGSDTPFEVLLTF